MAIITISRGSYSHGKEIAEKVAAKLGYECISREVLIEASEFFNVAEMKLTKSIHDAPSILERMTHGRERYLLYIKAALLEHVKNNNVVYHGHAGHLLIPEFPNVLKVRIVADLESRVAFMQQQEGISRNEALKRIEADDRQRELWTRYLYNREIKDPMLYDMIIRIDRLGVDEACDLICTAAESEQFRVDEKILQNLADLALRTRVEAALVDVCETEVSVSNGVVQVNVEAGKIRKTGASRLEVQEKVKERIVADIFKEVCNIVGAIPGVKEVHCEVNPPDYS
ncbi:MAG TPA: cytidylate kinase-like family protein [Desulfobacteraceae bacterium]|nr:cytidylate kinase-like family protein [Desulfobacteraceae bacterium]